MACNLQHDIIFEISALDFFQKKDLGKNPAGHF